MASDNVTSIAGPGRPGLSFEAYEQAYHELSGPDGTPPSQRQLRKFLGTGSNTTLASYRRRIAEERVVDEKPLEPGTVDSELMATVQRLAHQIHIDEAQVADDRVDELQKEADNRVRIAETTMEKRLQDTSLLEYRANQAEKDLASVRAELAESQKAVSDLQSEHQAFKEEHAAVSQREADANRRIGALTRELTQQHDALDAAREAEKTAINEAKAASKEQQAALVSVQETLSQEQSALAAMSEKHASLSDRFTERNRLIETQNTQQRELQVRLDGSVESRDAALVKLDDVRRERETLSGQCIELTAQLASAKQLSEASEERLTSEIMEKTAQITHLQETVTTLSKEKKKKT